MYIFILRKKTIFKELSNVFLSHLTNKRLIPIIIFVQLIRYYVSVYNLFRNLHFSIRLIEKNDIITSCSCLNLFKWQSYFVIENYVSDARMFIKMEI